MRTFRWAGCAALSLLAACSGGGGGSSGGGGGGGATAGTPTPSPGTPTPSPSTPTPSPSSPSYSSFAALAGAQSYSSGCVSFGGANGGAPTTQSNNFYSLNSGLVSYNPSGEVYTVLGTTFGSANRISGSAGTTSAYTKPETGTGATMRFDFVQPTPGVYSRVSSMLVQGQLRGNYCVMGVPTLNTDIPTAATVTFTRFQVRGRAFDKRSGPLVEYDLGNSTATMVVDLTTGQFTARLNLVGTNGATTVSLGSEDITGSLMEATSGLVGGPTTPPAPAPLPGTGGSIIRPIRVDGGFFGPQGAEFAYVFSREERLNNSSGSLADITFTYFGTVAGAR